MALNPFSAMIVEACMIDPAIVRGVQYVDIAGVASVELTVAGESPVDRCTVVFVKE